MKGKLDGNEDGAVARLKLIKAKTFENALYPLEGQK